MRRLRTTVTSFFMAAGAAAAALAIPAVTQAQAGTQRDPAQMMQRMNQRLFAGITLTAAQSDSINALNARHAAAMRAMFESAAANGGMSADSRTKMMELRTSQRAELRAVLTPEQQAVFDKNVADMEKARANRGAGGPPQP